jgi:cytochrome c peroxidase
MTRLTTYVCAFGINGILAGSTASGQALPNLYLFPNRTGFLATYNASGQPLDLAGPFFQSLGTNGRSCGSCHRPAQGWSVSAEELKARFEATQGLDPVFSTNDGSNCDHDIETSTVGGRRQAYSLLIDRGLFRIELAVPADAEFRVVSVVNAYGCSAPATLSVYRRPLPATNLRFLSSVMWDGRESSPQTGTQKIAIATNPADLLADLEHQAADAVSGHAQARIALSPEQRRAIASFEMGLSTAQAIDSHAGRLDDDGAIGGPTALALQTTPAFFLGINDPLGGNPSGAAFNSKIFNLFDLWNQSAKGDADRFNQRTSIARGQILFNSKPIQITGVAGLNDDSGLAVISGTCGTCHDAPNAGNHSIAIALDIGVGDATSPLDLSYLPTFTFQNNTTHEIKMTTDPGRALITGLWKDLGKVKGPVLRGLAARAPYFHNGSARSLTDVLEFYDRRFHLRFTPQEKMDLVAFLNVL